MTISRLWLANYRNHRDIRVSLDPGVTLLSGPNGWGKTNLLEAIAWLSKGSSFRGAPTDALVQHGYEKAIVRAEVYDGQREVLLEAEIASKGRNRIQVNRQRVARLRDLLGYLRATVFTPDDLALVKSSPSGRRTWLDDLLVDLHPPNYALRTEFDRILRQRNALLKQARGRLTPDVATTLDVWDAKLTAAGEAIAAVRRATLIDLEPLATAVSDQLSSGRSTLTVTTADNWSAEGLGVAIQQARSDDVRRGMTTLGPHRDDVILTLNGMSSRTHASQGEQRSVALALRLAGHRLVAQRTGVEPVVLLDDVFSELDSGRSEALVSMVPDAQVVITTAGVVPEGVRIDKVLDLDRLTNSVDTGFEASTPGASG